MKHIVLKDRLEINAMWRLIIGGKFLTDNVDLAANPITNRLIDKVLKLYKEEFAPNGEWNIKEVFIEDSIDVFSAFLSYPNPSSTVSSPEILLFNVPVIDVE